MWAVALKRFGLLRASHWPGNERAGAPADIEPAGVPGVGRTGESAVNGSVPVNDVAEGDREAGRGAPAVWPGNERTGESANVDPAAVLWVGVSDG